MPAENDHAYKAATRKTIKAVNSRKRGGVIRRPESSGSVQAPAPHSRKLWPEHKQQGHHYTSVDGVVTDDYSGGSCHHLSIQKRAQSASRFLQVETRAPRFAPRAKPAYVTSLGPGTFDSPLPATLASKQVFSRLDDRFHRPRDAYDNNVAAGDYFGDVCADAAATAHLPSTIAGTPYFDTAARFGVAADARFGQCGGLHNSTALRGEFGQPLSSGGGGGGGGGGRRPLQDWASDEKAVPRQLPWGGKRGAVGAEFLSVDTGHRRSLASSVAVSDRRYAVAFRSKGVQCVDRAATTTSRALGPGAYPAADAATAGVRVRAPHKPSLVFSERGDARMRAGGAARGCGGGSSTPWHVARSDGDAGRSEYLGAVLGTHASPYAAERRRHRLSSSRNGTGKGGGKGGGIKGGGSGGGGGRAQSAGVRRRPNHASNGSGGSSSRVKEAGGSSSGSAATAVAVAVDSDKRRQALTKQSRAVVPRQWERTLGVRIKERKEEGEGIQQRQQRRQQQRQQRQLEQSGQRHQYQRRHQQRQQQKKLGEQQRAAASSAARPKTAASTSATRNATTDRGGSSSGFRRATAPRKKALALSRR